MQIETLRGENFRGEISKSLQTRNFCIKMDQRTMLAVVGGCLLHVAHMGSKTQILRLEKMHQFIYKMLIFILMYTCSAQRVYLND